MTQYKKIYTKWKKASNTEIRVISIKNNFPLPSPNKKSSKIHSVIYFGGNISQKKVLRI